MNGWMSEKLHFLVKKKHVHMVTRKFLAMANLKGQKPSFSNVSSTSVWVKIGYPKPRLVSKPNGGFESYGGTVPHLGAFLK